MSELNDLNPETLPEEITYQVEDSEVIPIPIDPTLTRPGEAADAKATGDAIRGIGHRLTVDGVEADENDNYVVTPGEIPMSAEPSAPTLSDTLTALSDRTGANIPVSTDDPTAIAQALDTLDTKIDSVDQDIRQDVESEITGIRTDTQTAITEIQQNVDTAITGIQSSLRATTAQATTLQPGSDATVTVTEVSGHEHFAFGIPRGEKGDKGDTGEKGDTGDSYILTAQDKRDIADLVLADFPTAEGTVY